MLDLLWLPLLGGVLIGAVALVVGGLPLAIATIREQRAVRTDLRRAIEGLEARQAALSEAIEATDDRITVEVKRRASQAGVEVRRGQKAEEAEILALVEGRATGAAPRVQRPGLLRGVNRGPAS